MEGCCPKTGPVLLPVLFLSICACTQQEIPGPEQDGCIRFETVASKSSDRFGAGDSFRVWAEAEDGQKVMEGQEVTLTEDGWRYAPVKYWPGRQKVSFRAVSPADERTVRRSSTQENLLEVSLGEGAGSDILYAPPVSESAGNTVRLDFRHILSRISIHGKAERLPPATKFIRIREIRIGPFDSEGVWNMDSAEWEETGKPVVFRQEFTSNIESTGSVPITDLFLIPAMGHNDSQLVISWEIVTRKSGSVSYSRSDTVSLAGKSFLQSTAIGITLSVDGRTDLIEFRDERTKALCVARFDTDGDGELSYAEAASVTTLKDYFKQKDFQWFNELKFFTGLASLNANCFNGCAQLQEITLPEGIRTIQDGAFKNCTSLVSIQMPHSLHEIGPNVFSGCSRLTSIDLSWFSGTLGQYLFANATSLREIRWPSAVKNVPFMAFQGCTSLKDLSGFPPGLILGDSAFDGCTGLTFVNLGHFSAVGNYAFSHCSGLMEVDLSRVSDIRGNGVFSHCTGLNWVSFGNQLTRIPDMTFYGCTGLHEVELPEHLQQIGKSAFFGCTGLTELDIPEDVSTIGVMAFGGCSQVKSIVSRAKKAPSTFADSFGDEGRMTGSEVTGSKTLRVLVFSTGYNSDGWATLTGIGGFKKTTAFVL